MYTESKQKWLERNRPPRVQISYDVETAGAIEKKELPLVVGILADLSGDPVPETVVPVVDRRFVEIDRDVFNAVMKKIGPRLDLSAASVPTVEGLTLSDTIKFEKIDDFDPEHIVQSVASLKELLDTRNELRDLMAKLDGNVKLEGRLTEIFVKENQDVAREARDAKLQQLLPTDVKPTPEPDPKPDPEPEPDPKPEPGPA